MQPLSPSMRKPAPSRGGSAPRRSPPPARHSSSEAAGLYRVGEAQMVGETDGEATQAQAVLRRHQLPQTVNPPSPSSISPARRSRFAVATTSPRNPVGAPVASPRSAADRIDTFSSRPIRGNGR